MLSIDERFYNWVVNKKGWFKLMIPVLFVLIWVNLVTDGLNCDFTSIFQTSCESENQNNFRPDKIGSCSVDEHCKEICSIWSKTKKRGSLVPLGNVDYRCFEGKCECNNHVEICSKDSGAICPWV